MAQMLKVKMYINGKKQLITSKNLTHMSKNMLNAVKPALLSINTKYKVQCIMPDAVERDVLEMVYNAQSLIPLINKRLGFISGEPLRANRMLGWKY